MAASNGAVLWSGPSLLDGAPIVVIAVGLRDASSNRKTGGMLQTYIIRSDMDPVQAVRTGDDASICGNCVHRGRIRAESLEPGQESSLTSEPQPSADAQTVFEGLAARGYRMSRTCYVAVGQGPLGVWRAYQRGLYPAAESIADVGAGRLVRLGTYGDPAAVPAYVWQWLTEKCSGYTGYTHQWRTCDAALKTLCMASADSVSDAQAAQAAGWRTFRVALPCHPARESNEARCPASAESGRKLTCAQCLACNGANGRRGSIVINAHGGWAVMKHINSRGVRPYFAR